MPVQDRRYFIMKHNAEQQHIEQEREALQRQSDDKLRNNGNLNSYARMEQENNMHRRNR